MLFLLLALGQSSKKKNEVVEMDDHRFRHAVFRRDLLEIWVALITSKDAPNHPEATKSFDEAFAMGKGFLNFAYLDGQKNLKTPRRLNLRKLPQFCVFHPGGETCQEATVNARQLLNIASQYLPDSSEKATQKWLEEDDTSSAVLFTEKSTTPSLWAAISYKLKNYPVRIGISRDHEFAKLYNITEFPAILFSNFTHKIIYEGKYEFNPLRDTLKKFMQKRLMKLKPVSLIKPVSAFERTCEDGEKVCFLVKTEKPSAELEHLRRKHTTNLIEIFAGTDGPAEEMQDGSIMMVQGESRREVANLEELGKLIERIISGEFAWEREL